MQDINFKGKLYQVPLHLGVKFVAEDADGEVYGYKVKPKFCHRRGEWIPTPNGGWHINLHQYRAVSEAVTPWESLVEVSVST
jgi:hypothetical protein